jgi:chromosome segregation ATPase
VSNTSTEFDSALSILKTYQQINDKVTGQREQMRNKLQQKTVALEQELHSLKEKYRTLQSELSQRDQRLNTLSRELSDRTEVMQKLQEDYEHAISHVQQQSKASTSKRS